ncbi:hypothetical protein [Sediminibacillus halophilus]|uniref:Guanylate cyclase domain-containing protein n=1 Tax=Sediminibacillus halophilus TaxID=482461 RepID=A0A1G9T6K0_9BACI|nr:hypothetical protein [Sediminibacillus halophilus]SDM43353.1 hypothetical protein SAMN05216244_2456 [Sediminibacillus halophilus]
MNSENGYKEKILVFFDVLGFKNLIMNKYKNQPEKIEDILTTMHLLSEPDYKSDVIVFSDSVINILDLKPIFNDYGQKFSDYLNVIIDRIAAIQINMLTHFGILIRGSIVIGNIKYNSDKGLLFGQALINAYELESKYAIYPRILIDETVVKVIDGDTDQLNITRDFDGQYYIDPLKWLVKLDSEKQSLLNLKEKVLQKINNERNIAVLSKYNWLLNKILERDNT